MSATFFIHFYSTFYIKCTKSYTIINVLQISIWLHSKGGTEIRRNLSPAKNLSVSSPKYVYMTFSLVLLKA